MSKGALSTLAYRTAPLRRFGASSIVHYLALAVGLIAMTAFTVPESRNAAGKWLSACLWCCLAYFAVESAFRADHCKGQNTRLRDQ